MCANNYLGLSNHPALIAAAKESYDKWGFGLSSVRFICGTQGVHKELVLHVVVFIAEPLGFAQPHAVDNGGVVQLVE